MDENALAPWLVQADSYVQRSKAPNTLKAYRSDWRAFETFCQAHNRSSLPATPETVAAYAAECAGHLKANTVERRLAAISQAHQIAGFVNPAAEKLVRTVMAGIRRTKGTARKAKDPLSPGLLRTMFRHLDPGLRGVRDRALLLVGFAGALRRSELGRHSI